MYGPTHAVVVGGGLAGMLAATVLAGHPTVGTVTVVERDELPDDATERRGLPQGHHAHVLMSSGARIIEGLLPGVTRAWLDAGAHRLGLPHGYVMLLPQGWLPRWETEEFVVSCSRALLDHVVRQRVRRRAGVRVLDRSRVTGLLGDAGRVTGVRVRREGVDEELPAALVVDASGRASRSPRWLAELGAGPVTEDLVDSGLRYATRIFRAPQPAARGFPVVNVQADPTRRRPGQTAALVPIEGGRWLVTLSGTRGGEPPADERRFVAFARGMRHPVVGDLIADAEPLGPVRVTNSTANRRRRFDKMDRWPAGFVVLGDAVASFNPVYGHGMSVAAKEAAILRAELDRLGLAPGLAGSVQRAVAAVADEGWQHAAGSDIRFPDVRGAAPSTIDRIRWRYQDRLFRTALDRRPIAEELIRVFSLSAPSSRLRSPRVALATLRGPRAAPPSEPPFTARELAVVRHDAL
ncbi:FAD-binding protein [Micromonospora echinofusca]|uniref:NAD(P)/FAD-dependent oxidoreductase n=1 Tax=Micromonospora echinofusca TaxID=47858 RepID=UPI000C701A00|nr:FAD-binding protein [Micromonospora sp. MSM11]MCL7456114.1 FAD-binding protein [Micromonospora sp. MSM11]